MSIWSRWDIYSVGPDKFELLYQTNDDDDDGWPDGETVSATYGPMSWKRALHLTGGGSRIGLYGQPVDVYLDGVKFFGGK
jgi:hypothetical protein